MTTTRSMTATVPCSPWWRRRRWCPPDPRRHTRGVSLTRRPAFHTGVVADAGRVLVTGAAGKVGQAFIGRLLASTDERFAGFTVRALCHNRMLPAGPRLEVVTGSIDQPETAGRALEGVTHVVHLATSKETPATIIDVAVKGL